MRLEQMRLGKAADPTSSLSAELSPICEAAEERRSPFGNSDRRRHASQSVDASGGREQAHAECLQPNECTSATLLPPQLQLAISHETTRA
eukprot:CAMPEP_0115871572 /NCGR_PEP_ID=MMETSP0287-20121206/22947_1 /TAXON_ID=412157 /ORGANISM="Chrysochromulina rotalis, Strain UIO044" /LENGTH=89 /DNA_ID=CAMNT_0003326401 /DNA_START=19 /DNA_END=283 /DNA_ORIENTATION=+